MQGYYPEMGDTRPEGTQIDATYWGGNHYYLTTPLQLKGRGIVHLNTLTAEELTPAAQHKAGWHEYRVTDAAIKKLDSQFRISNEILLD